MYICHVVPSRYIDLSIKHSDIVFLGLEFPKEAIAKAVASTKLLMTDFNDVPKPKLGDAVKKAAALGIHLGVCRSEWENPEETIKMHKDCFGALPKDVQLKLVCVAQGKTAPDWQACLMEMVGAFQDNVGAFGFPADVMIVVGSYYSGNEKDVYPNRGMAIKRLGRRQMQMNNTGGILLGSGNGAAKELMEIQIQAPLVDKAATTLAFGAALAHTRLRDKGAEHDKVELPYYNDDTEVDAQVLALAEDNMVFLNEYAHGV